MKQKLKSISPVTWVFIAFIILSAAPILLPILAIGGAAYYFYQKKQSNFADYNFTKDIPNHSELFKNMKIKPQKVVLLALGVILATIFIPRSIVIVDAGFTSVFQLFGKVADQELSSGIHLINPLGNVQTMDIRTKDYTMSISSQEGKKSGNDSITAITKEGLTVGLDITILYRLNEANASDVFKTVGQEYEEVIIRPAIRSVIREVIALYEAKDIYSARREEAAFQIQERLLSKLGDRGIVVEETLLRDVQLPQRLSDSIQEKLTAEQESQKYEFILEVERKEAERIVIEATAQRDAQTIINQSLTDRYLQFLYVEGLKEREGTIYVPTDPNNGLPTFRGL